MIVVDAVPGRAVLVPRRRSFASRSFHRARAERRPTTAVRMPNGALTSLAGNVDPHHRVAAADLLLVQNRVRETVERLVAEHEPDVVGVSGMELPRQTDQGE